MSDNFLHKKLADDRNGYHCFPAPKIIVYEQTYLISKSTLDHSHPLLCPCFDKL